jgi:hypothetical protein
VSEENAIEEVQDEAYSDEYDVEMLFTDKPKKLEVSHQASTCEKEKESKSPKAILQVDANLKQRPPKDLLEIAEVLIKRLEDKKAKLKSCRAELASK